MNNLYEIHIKNSYEIHIFSDMYVFYIYFIWNSYVLYNIWISYVAKLAVYLSVCVYYQTSINYQHFCLVFRKRRWSLTERKYTMSSIKRFLADRKAKMAILASDMQRLLPSWCFLAHLSQRLKWAIYHSASSVRPSVVRPSVNFHILNFFSRTAWWILMKLGRDEVLMVPYKCCCFSDRSAKGADPGRGKNRSRGSPSSRIFFFRLEGYSNKPNR